MKAMLLAAVALAGLMEEAEASASSGGGAQTDPIAGLEGKVDNVEERMGTVANVDRAPDVADTSGDVPGQPAGAHLDSAAKAEEPAAAVAAVALAEEDEFAAACQAGTPRIALVGKYSDRVAVQLKNKAHLEQLKGEHPGAVEVQP